jgi:hypothetical protein
MKRTLLPIVCLLAVLATGQAQCFDFTDLTGPNVICQHGSFINPFMYTGVATDRHTVITEQGTDPYTGNQLTLLPPGENAVVKLGNLYDGGEAQAITYTFTVDPNYAVLLVNFAVVLQDPHHYPDLQPHFVMRVLDANGHQVSGCTEYDVRANADIPGFIPLNDIRWRPWTEVGFDLSEYAGQQVSLQFVTYGCAYEAHFGYAYFTAHCIGPNLTGECDGDSITFTAPPGFEHYEWTNGDTTSISTYPLNGTTSVSCQITSAIGCVFTLGASLTADDLPAEGATFYDTICEGDSYHDHLFDLPPQNLAGTQVVRNTFFNTANCSGNDIVNTLYLTVVRQYTDYFDYACQGEDYNRYGFEYTDLQPGIITDTTFTVGNSGCDTLYYILHLTVSTNAAQTIVLQGSTITCEYESTTYLVSTSSVSALHWSLPEGVSSLSELDAPGITLCFTEQADNPSTISVSTDNGCHNNTAQLTVWHYPQYHSFVQDTICAGSAYDINGFHLSVQNSPGVHVFTNNYTTVHGCDSVEVLQLVVNNAPVFTLSAEPTEICTGESTSIVAEGDPDSSVPLPPIPHPIVPGDILCTDGSIVKPSMWPCGKTALGVVFYVDASLEHGWAVHLEEQGVGLAWGPSVNLSNTNYGSARAAIYDTNGYTNTLTMRNNSLDYIAGAVDFDNGWYIPAMGQLRMLFSEEYAINATMQLLGGTILYPSVSMFSVQIWSSSEVDNYFAWYMGGGGRVNNQHKNYMNADVLARMRVRSIRNF